MQGDRWRWVCWVLAELSLERQLSCGDCWHVETHQVGELKPKWEAAA